MEVSSQLYAPAALPLGRAPDTHWIEDWVSPRASLDAVAKRKKKIPLLSPQKIERQSPSL